MAVRRPLVLTADGTLSELPAGDTLPGVELDPGTLGLLACSDDPAILTGTFKPASGALSLGLAVAAGARAAGAAVTVTVEVTTAGVTLTLGQNLVGLYRSDGVTLTRVGVSADLNAAWLTVGVKTASVTLSSAVAPGDVLYVALLAVGVTTPTFRAAAAATLINAAPVRRRASLVGQASLPAAVTLSGTVAGTQAPGMLLT